jgi:hypothetical protein
MVGSGVIEEDHLYVRIPALRTEIISSGLPKTKQDYDKLESHVNCMCLQYIHNSFHMRTGYLTENWFGFDICCI